MVAKLGLFNAHRVPNHSATHSESACGNHPGFRREQPADEVGEGWPGRQSLPDGQADRSAASQTCLEALRAPIQQFFLAVRRFSSL